MAGSARHATIVNNMVTWLGSQRRQPGGRGRVALITFVCGRRMARWFSNGDTAVMTARTRRSRSMPVLCWQPAGSGVAIAAREGRLGGCRMRSRLASSGNIIVAARTWRSRGVLVLCGEPANKAVAGIASICCLGDHGMAPEGLADSRSAIVAGRTGPGRYADVIPAGR